MYRPLGRDDMGTVAFVLLAALISSASIAEAAQASRRWPIVVPLHRSIAFEHAEDASATFTIRSPQGIPRYLLECHTASHYDPDFDYSGDFECRLSALYAPMWYSTLLTDDPHQSRDWQSRGRMLTQELWGDCANYPEYGRLRHFRLRGMQITFRFDDLEFQGSVPGVKGRPKLASFRFTLDVQGDPTAVTPIAEPVPFEEPRQVHPEDRDDFSLDCSVVRHRDAANGEKPRGAHDAGADKE